MTAVDWHAPRVLDDAVAFAAAGATVVGGGVGLLSEATAGDLGAVAVDLRWLGLDRLDATRIGAMTTIDRLASATSPVRGDAVRDAAAATANPNLRRRITVGGVLAARASNADLLVALLAHRAEVESVDCATGETRWEPLAAFQRREPSAEIVLAVRLRDAPASAYRRAARRGGPNPAIACVAVAAGGDGAHCWIGGLIAHPIRFDREQGLPAEVLADHRASAAVRRRAAEALLRDLNVPGAPR